MRHTGIAERKRLRKIFLGKHLLGQSIGKAAGLLGQHDSARNAGEHLADGIHIGIGFPMSAAEIPFVHQVSVADHEQTTVLAGRLHILKRLIQPSRVDARAVSDVGGVLQGSPAAFGVGRWKVEWVADGRARSEVQEGHSDGKGEQCSPG
jgi:hypothetical protein